jgi:selT/selW/selH-like putative selenoprotein
LQKAINAQFPEVKVVGGNYPPSSTNQMLSHLVFGLQIAGFAFMFFGEFLCRQLGIAVPPIYYQLQEKKMFVLFGLFFVGNSLSNSLLSTGAFEVTVHEDSPELPGRLLWSKLATGNVPTTDYVLQRLQSEFGLRPIAHEPIYS